MRRRMMFGRERRAEYLRFTAEQANSTITLKSNGFTDPISLMARSAKDDFHIYPIGLTITLESVGDWIEFYGDNEYFSTSIVGYYSFDMTGRIAASGNVMSVVGFADTCTPYCFKSLFYGCTSLTAAPELPAKVLAEYCYNSMFAGCTSLEVAPSLPATILSARCYAGMFNGCETLSVAKVRFTEWNQEDTRNWMLGVSNTGNFRCPSALAQTRGESNIPDNWTIETF